LDTDISPLLNCIESHEAAATRNQGLADERVKALNYYLGKPFGNEVEGRSQVVSRDVSDTIEWIKPSLMRIFASGDEIVAFDPRGPEDVEQAQQESDFTNHILTQKNNWFRTSYVWFTDALMQKNAYVKAWWEEKTDVTTESYEGITDQQLMMMGQDQEIEITAQEDYPDPSIPPEMLVMMQMSGQQAPMLHNVKCKRTNTYGCVKYKEIPPERTIVSNWASSIDLEDVDFFEHFEWKTLSDIKAMKLKVPETIGDESASEFSEDEEEARNLYGEPWDGESDDKTTKRYKLREIWVKYDDNGDGISELLHCFVLGKSILSQEEVEFIPAAALTPKMMPHRHVGQSVYDDIKDIQEIKSALLRGTLDNMYLANNGQYGVSNKVNLDDMLTSRPGGIKRVDTNGGDVGGHIFPFVHPNMMAQGLESIQYMDDIKQNRTGVTAYVTSVDENVLNKTASGTSMLQNAAMAKIELVARVFAETGVKRLMWLIHALSLKHARKAEVVRLRNKFVSVDPRQWKSRMDMTVSVGLGTGNREQMAMNLQMILALQKETLPLGLASLENVYHALKKFTNSVGFKDDESFWTKPPEGAKLPPPPDPLAVEKMKQEGETQRTAMKGQADGQKTMFEAKAEAEKTMFDTNSQKEIELFKQAEETRREQMRIESAERIEQARIASEERKAQFQAQQAQATKAAEIESDERKTRFLAEENRTLKGAEIASKERQAASKSKNEPAR
jgi:hypothetical protein